MQNVTSRICLRNIHRFGIDVAARYAHTLSTAIHNRDLEGLQRELRSRHTASTQSRLDTQKTQQINAQDTRQLDAWLTKLPPSATLDEISIDLVLESTPRPLLKVFRNAFKSKNAGRVIELFDRLVNDTTRPQIDSRILVAVVSANALIHNYEGARWAVTAVSKLGYNFNSASVAHQTGLDGEALLRAQSYVDALQYEHVLRSRESLLSSIKRAADDGMRRYILDLYYALQKSDYSTDEDEIYAAFVRAFTRTSKRNSPPLPAGVTDRPLHQLYSHSLNAVLEAEIVRHTSKHRIMEILGCMARKQTLPDEDTAAALISKLIDARNRDGMDVFDEIQTMYANSARGTPTKICNALLSGLIKVGMSDVALDVFRQIEQPSIVTYNILIRSAVLRNDSHITIALLKELKEKNITPDAHTFSMLLIYLRKQSHSNAIGVVSRTMTDCDIKPDLHIYSNMIDILAKEGQMAEAVALLDKIEDDGVATTSVTYTSIISAYLSMSPDGLEEAQAMMTRMKRRGLAFTHALFNYAILASLHNQHRFAPWVLLEQMQREPNVHINKNTLYVLMKGFYDNRRYDDCERLLKFIQDNHLNSPSDDAFGRIVNKVRRKLV